MMNQSHHAPLSGPHTDYSTTIQLAAFTGGLSMHCYRLNMLGAHITFTINSDTVALQILKPVRLNQPSTTVSGDTAELETTCQHPQDACYTYVYFDEIISIHTPFKEALHTLKNWSDHLEEIDADLPGFLCHPPSSRQTE